MGSRFQFLLIQLPCRFAIAIKRLSLFIISHGKTKIVSQIFDLINILGFSSSS